jgi:fimbrial isopeptide formation D2 family protein/LPXTG-motif cell wall-anchored protein
MKLIKKTGAIFIALIMLIAVAVPAMADPVKPAAAYTITAPDNGHTYEVYQIFTGDYSENETGEPVLSNIKWGQNGTGTAGETVEDTVIEALEAVAAAGTSDADRLEVIERYANLETDPFGTVTNGTPLNNVTAGYYLIRDVDGRHEGEHDSYTTYIVQVVGNVDIEPKSDIPTSQKKVDDKNDSNATEDAVSWQDSADYDIGDTVPYKLEAVLPDNVSAYDTYELSFIDILSAGLTYEDGSAEIFVNNESKGKLEPTETNYVDLSDGTYDEAYAGGKVLTWSIEDIKAAYNADDDDVITITYNATVNENAKIGRAGNPNKMHIEFSNNPNGDGKGKTTDDTVIVFTYKTVINKVDGENQPLAGAEFSLEKFVADVDGQDTYKNVPGSWTEQDVVVSGEGSTTFTFSGLDDGEYRLTETKTPTGYNTVDPIYFTVTAEHDTDSADPQLTKLEVTGITNAEGQTLTGEITFNYNVADGQISTNIVNESGTLLPETGGTGTTVFYIVGAVLVLGVIVVFVARARMRNGKED